MYTQQTNLDIFEQKLKQLQEEMGIYLIVSIYKNAVDGEYSEVVLSADEERSVYIQPLVKLNLKEDKDTWRKAYK